MPGTYKDIQNITGLSLSTISKYFNGGNLREENRLSIEKAIEELDFTVNAFARGLKSRQSHTIGILVPDLSSTFNAIIMEQVCEILRSHGYGSIVCTCNGNQKAEKSSLSFLLDKMVDGIITIPMDETGKHLEEASKRGTPVVLIDHLAANFKTDAVIVNNQEAGHMAAREFILCGHRHIGIIAGPEDMDTMHLRCSGFLEEFQKENSRKAWVCRSGLSMEEGYDSVKKLLSAKHGITGLFCTNYDLTLGAYIALQEMHKQIPNDISVIGFDNMLLSGILNPPLTMIVQPVKQIAVTAAELMLERLEKPDFPGTRIIELETQLLAGASVKPI